MTNYQKYFRRTFELALRGGKKVATNPQVGAIIVSNDRIIGEGWHQEIGEAHAEINALKSVKEDDIHLLKNSKIFVSLEPCAHFGKTPPCALAIVEAGIPEVHIAMVDPTEKVAGKGIKILQKAGIKVELHNLSSALRIVDSFVKIQFMRRPKILLKYAQSSDGFISKKGEQTWLTNSHSKRLVHAYRAKVGAILIGRKTAEIDDPSLTTRFGFGSNPLRIIIDLNGQLNSNLNLFSIDKSIGTKTVILTVGNHPLSESKSNSIDFHQIDQQQDFYQQLFAFLISKGINTLLVEGGAKTLNGFITTGHWDEALVFTSEASIIRGVVAPQLPAKAIIESIQIKADKVKLYRNP